MELIVSRLLTSSLWINFSRKEKKDRKAGTAIPSLDDDYWNYCADLRHQPQVNNPTIFFVHSLSFYLLKMLISYFSTIIIAVENRSKITKVLSFDLSSHFFVESNNVSCRS